jgi:hypothetical protein
MTRAMAAEEEFDDIGPDHELDLGEVEVVEFAPDFRIVFEVPFESDQLSGIEDYAKARGLNAIEAVQRLVSEALAAHARR